MPHSKDIKRLLSQSLRTSEQWATIRTENGSEGMVQCTLKRTISTLVQSRIGFACSAGNNNSFSWAHGRLWRGCAVGGGLQLFPIRQSKPLQSHLNPIHNSSISAAPTRLATFHYTPDIYFIKLHPTTFDDPILPPAAELHFHKQNNWSI